MQISDFMLTTFTIKCLQNLINHRTMNNVQDKHPTYNAEQLCNLDKRDRYLSFLMLSGDKK